MIEWLIFWSPPIRAAWIETVMSKLNNSHIESPPIRAAWIETNKCSQVSTVESRRRLSGRRGLKQRIARTDRDFEASPPIRAAWIETRTRTQACVISVSPPIRAAWIETLQKQDSKGKMGSRRLSGRRGLKQQINYYRNSQDPVAAYPGGVD